MNKLKLIALSFLMILPGFCFANMNGGLHISTGAVVLFFTAVLLSISNAILCLVNVFRRKRGIRNYNIFATSFLFLGDIYLYTQDWKAGAVATFVLLVHVLCIRLSYNKQILDEQV
ncbi:MAG: hypothetical protein WC716_03130 [Chitinophagaceae bacterium]|jgi:hypothetical protein